jgi:hypothetical protein
MLPLALLLAALPAAAQKLSDEEAKEGFEVLFNGKDFTGWRFDNSSAFDKLPDNWKVEDGVIKLAGGSKPHLASQWDYEDFDLRLEWRALKPGYNSGVYVRSGRAVGANQINLAEKDAGHLMGGTASKVAKAVPELQKSVGEWNEWRVLAVGDKLTFWCNGKQAWEIDDFKVKRGYLGLQAEGHKMEFRNLRIKELGYDGLNDARQWADKGPGRWADGELTVAATADEAYRTAKTDYKDCVLRLEFKGDKGDLGTVGLRGGSVRVHVGHVEKGSGGISGLGGEPSKKLDNPIGQWNYLEVRLKGPTATVWLNGTVVTDKADLKKLEKSEEAGGVALHVQTGALRFRNLRIKELKE